jgi:hypothetical protein
LWTRFHQEDYTGSVRLTHKQVLALAGEYYSDFVAADEDEPGGSDPWDLGFDVAQDLEDDRKGREDLHAGAADRLLQRTGLVVDENSRKRLLLAINHAFGDEVSRLRRRSQGDYSPDPNADRFSKRLSRAPEPSQTEAGEPVTLSDLFDLWRTDHSSENGAARTVHDFRQKLDSLAKFPDHEEAQRH